MRGSNNRNVRTRKSEQYAPSEVCGEGAQSRRSSCRRSYIPGNASKQPHTQQMRQSQDREELEMQIYSAARAKRIAGDMAHAVAGNTSNNTASVSNMHILREWVSMEDEKVRPTHVVADGQQVDLDQPFRVGGYFLRFPGDPLGPMQEVAGCRCVALMKRGQKPRVEDVPNWMIGRKL